VTREGAAIQVVNAEHPTAQYDVLSDLVEAALELRQRLNRRTVSFLYRWSFPKLPVNPTGPTERHRQQLLVSAATESERRSPLFSCVTATYWIEELAAYLYEELELDADRLEALRRVHELRERALVGRPFWYSFTAVVGVLIAIVGFIAAQVPKESFAVIGWSDDAYGVYRLWLLGIFLSLVIYAAILARRVAGRSFVGRGQVVSATGLVLKYFAIRLSHSSGARDEPHARGDETSVSRRG
jgi:hypothetical protein